MGAKEDIETAINEIAADQTVYRVVLQCFLVNIAGAQGPEMLASMKRQVLGSLAQTLPDSGDSQGAERRKQLTLMRAELLFQEIEQAMTPTASTTRPS